MGDTGIDVREKLILEYLLNEGYARTASIAARLKTVSEKGSSIENVRKLLQKLHHQKLIDHKTLDTGEYVYFLSNRGLLSLGKSHEGYQRRLRRINFRSVQHYWEVRQLEKQMLQDIEKTGCTSEGINEFTDDQEQLQLKLKQRGRIVYVRSDAQIKVYQDGVEHLVLRLEMDMGTESIPTVMKKFDPYLLYFQSSLIDSYATYPVYILFVTQRNRIGNIIGKLNKHRIAPYLLFLPLETLHPFSLDIRFEEELNSEKISRDMRREFRKNWKNLSSAATLKVQAKEWEIEDDGKHYIIRRDKKELLVSENTNLFAHPVIINAQNNPVSLISIVKAREPLLRLKNAIQAGGKKYPEYEVTIYTVFSTPHRNPFFPMMVDVKGRQVLWSPHGYLKIRKRSSPEQIQDALFALIFSVKEEDLLMDKLLPYEVFLSHKEEYLSKLCSIPIYNGIIIILQAENQIAQVNAVLKDLGIRERTRFILQSDCQADKVWEEPVWRKSEGDGLSLLKDTSVTVGELVKDEIKR